MSSEPFVIEKKKESRLKRIVNFFVRYKFLNLLALPGIIYFVVFHYAPIAGLVIAFKDYSGMGGIQGIIDAKWVGMQHFENLIASPSFWRLLRNTLLISGYRLLWGFPAPIIFALLLNEIKNQKWKNTIQTISYMPHFLSWVIVSGLAVMLLSPSSGPLVLLYDFLGMEPINLLGSKDHFRGVLVASSVWKDLGWGTIIYLAAIAGIPQEQYEVAHLEGATRWQRMRYITLPSISFVITIFFILQVGKIINENFEQIFNMYSPVVYEVSDVFETYIYRRGILQAEFSFTTAVGLFKSLASFILVLISNKMVKLLGSEGLW